MKVILLTSVVLLYFGVNALETFDQTKLHTTNRNNVYFIENDPEYDWLESMVSCARMNMSLLTIESEAKSIEVNVLVQSIVGKSIPLWVGGYRLNSSNEFHWISNGEKFGYTYWGNGPPDAGSYGNCAQMNWGNWMAWNDAECTQKFGFICEYQGNLCNQPSGGINSYGNAKYFNTQFNF